MRQKRYTVERLLNSSEINYRNLWLKNAQLTYSK